MARGKIITDTSRLDSTAAKVESLAGDYEREYNALFKTVGDLKSAWDGKDNVAFTTQIEGFRDDFQRMTRLMRDYAEYLKKAAAAYRATQDELEKKAKTLTQGS